MTRLPWADFLPALEEWVRRTGVLVRGEADVPGGPEGVAEPAPFDLAPEGPLPPALALRARALVAEMDALQAAGAARRASLLRASAYGA